MPPAKPRVVLDDARSETPAANLKDRVVSGAATFKSRKTAANTTHGVNSSSKAGTVTASATVPAVTSNAAAESEPELPHVRLTLFCAAVTGGESRASWAILADRCVSPD